MLDVIFYVVGGAIGIGLLIVIAFPRYFLPGELTKTTKVGASYWGCYEGQALQEGEQEEKITYKTVRKKPLVVAGSATYAAGRGVKMSGMG
jgi:hypothetical protein